MPPRRRPRRASADAAGAGRRDRRDRGNRPADRTRRAHPAFRRAVPLVDARHQRRRLVRARAARGPGLAQRARLAARAARCRPARLVHDVLRIRRLARHPHPRRRAAARRRLPARLGGRRHRDRRARPADGQAPRADPGRRMTVLVVITALLAGALGALLRYGATAIAARGRRRLPWAVLAVTIAGCLIGGVVLGLVERGVIGDDIRLIVLSGLAGGLTTFSTW